MVLGNLRGSPLQSEVNCLFGQKSISRLNECRTREIDREEEDGEEDGEGEDGEEEGKRKKKRRDRERERTCVTVEK